MKRRLLEQGGIVTEPRLAWSEDGDPGGSPVILGSSLGTTREMWRSELEALTTCRVIRFDHLGHGQSAPIDGTGTVDQLGEAVLELMDHLGIEHTSYAGLSLGGAVGQWLALNAPDRIDNLVLLATAPYFPDPQTWKERAETVRRDGLAAVADGAMERWFTDRFRQRRPGELAMWREMVAGTPVEGYAGCCEALADFDTRADLPNITTPTLAIAGADDPSTTPEVMQSFADSIAGCRLEVIEDAAHLVNVAQPHRVGTLLAQHLRGDA